MDAYIKNMYDPQRTAVNSAYNATAGDLNAQITNAPATYQPARNDAYTTALQQQRLYNENMANMGYSGAGGMSQTLQQRASNNLQSTLGTINTSQQEYINGLASELRNAAVTRDTALAGVEADKGSALIGAASAEQSRYDQLYAAGFITAEQYEQKTGIKPYVKKKSTPPKLTALEKYSKYIVAGYSSDQAAELSGYVVNATHPS